MELPTGKLDTLKSGAAALLDACAAIEPPGGTGNPDALAGLNSIIGKIVAAVSPLISQDLEKANPGRPWRVLLLNQGIVATRSHDTALMEQAFGVLTNNLPKDAGQFFTAGMQQMDALNYPEQVRAVMAKYHRQRNIDRSLH